MANKEREGSAQVYDRLDFGDRPISNMGGTEKNGYKKKLPTGKKFGQAWLRRLELAKKKQKSWAIDGEEYYKLYQGDKATWKKYSKLAGYPLVTISTNPIALNVDNDRDRILPKNPEFKVTPRVPYLYFQTPDGQIVTRSNEQAARKYQQIADVLALELDLRKTVKQAMTDSLITNLGVVKVGWDEVSKISHSSSHVEGEMGKVIGGMPSDVPNHQAATMQNYPWVTYVPWNRILLDPLAGSMEQVTWWAEEIITPKITSSAKEEDEVSVVANVALGEENEDMGSFAVRDENVDSDIKLCRRWEIHRREMEEDGEFCFYVMELYSDGTVKNHREYPKGVNDFVYTPLQFKVINGDLLGYSQIKYYAESAANTNLMKQLAMDYAIRGLPFISASAGTDKNTLKAITSGKVAKVVVGNNPDARQNFAPVGLPPLNQELFAVAGISASAEQMMSGRSLNDKLQGGEQTATEAKIISTVSGEILQSAVDTLRVFVATIMKKAVRAYASMLPDDERVEIPDSNGGFFQVEKQDLVGEVAIELSWQSSVREDDVVSRKLNMDLLNVLISLMTAMPNLNINVLPVIEKIAVASGYDDPGELVKKDPEEKMRLVLEYVGGILGGQQIMLPPDTDWALKYQELTQFAALVMNDPVLKAVFDVVPGAMQRLLDAIESAGKNSEMQGRAVEAGVKPTSKGGGGGSGAQNNRISQGTPNAGDMQAGVSRVGNVGGTGAGRMAGV